MPSSPRSPRCAPSARLSIIFYVLKLLHLDFEGILYPGADTHLLASQETLEVHWGKHHRTYVTNLNNQLKDKPLANKPLKEVRTLSAKLQPGLNAWRCVCLALLR